VPLQGVGAAMSLVNRWSEGLSYYLRDARVDTEEQPQEPAVASIDWLAF